jgi:hypothetical protein
MKKEWICQNFYQKNNSFTLLNLFFTVDALKFFLGETSIFKPLFI